MIVPINKLNQAKNEYQSQLKVYNTLINNLKAVFFEREIWRDETSPFKIKSELNLMKMTYAYLIGKCPNHEYDSQVRQSTRWNAPSDNYYVLYDEQYQQWRSTPPVYILKMKYLKEIHNQHIYNTWKELVEKEKCTLGYEIWKKKIPVTQLAEIMNEQLPNFHIVNESKLKIKNIIVIFPR